MLILECLLLAELPLPLSDAVQNAINNSDIELAKELISTYKLV